MFYCSRFRSILLYLCLTLALPPLAKATAPIPAPGSGYFKILNIERTLNVDEKRRSVLLRGKSLFSFSRPATGERIVSENDKDTKKAFPPGFTFNWVGEPEHVDLKVIPQESKSKYSRIHKHVGEHNQFSATETLETETGTRVKLEGWDRTEIDVGQNTTLEFTVLNGEDIHRIIKLKLIKGYLSVKITNPFEKIGQIEIQTPNAYFTPRGTRGLGSSKIFQFHIATSTDSSNITTTSFLNLEGQVSVDFTTLTRTSTAYVQTQLLLPKQEWKGSGRHDLALKTAVVSLKPDTEENPELRLSTALLHYQDLR